MTNVFVILFLFIHFYCLSFQETQLTLDMENHAVLPPRFRYAFSQQAPIPASASSQFSEYSLLEMIKKISIFPLIIVDLREESHGFINGHAVSWRSENNWGNKDKTLQEIEKELSHKIQQIQALEEVELFHKNGQKSQIIQIKNILTERELVEFCGGVYVHLPVTDHCKPSDQAVDQFILLIRKLNPGSWLHFHCRGGKGRSTTFLMMYDMLYSALFDSFENIVLRQKEAGGTDLCAFDVTSWKFPYLTEREVFLKAFYLYCQQANFKETLWSEWLQLRLKPMWG